ncbi:DUF3726 domain-containing protein [Pelagibacteraceae bacterium]|jgi:hypothetical protein|nr:DUF3726 domain-containing protein [Candidatus Pelagibacter sp.]MDC1485298.1 DUF3726 domain-containing protein [Pelagibacteraceae bacterium]
MKSLSEIETVSKRATKAAGFSWGVAEEVGKNIRIIEMYGLPGIKNLNDYFKKKKETNFENLNLINTNNKSVKSKICPIIAGINFLDQIKTLEVLNEIKFEKIGYPLLFLPFLSRGSEVVGKRIFVKFDEKEFLLNFNNNIYSNFLDNEIILLAQNVSVKFIDNSDSFTENEWHELYKLSENTFVEESETLKNKGAGAGLTDND